jgi:hypothetical protein
MMTTVLGAIIGPATTVEAADRSQVKAFGKPKAVLQAGPFRSCTQNELVGKWQLIKFDSPYQFRDPHAGYLLPYQMFQYSKQGGVKSAHSPKPLMNSTDEMFDAIPPAMSYQFQHGGIVRLTKQGREGIVETWRCAIFIEDGVVSDRDGTLQRGDLIMTLVGRHGDSLFVRYLRRVPT